MTASIRTRINTERGARGEKRDVYLIGGLFRGRPVCGRVWIGSVLQADLGKGWIAFDIDGRSQSGFPSLERAKTYLYNRAHNE